MGIIGSFIFLVLFIIFVVTLRFCVIFLSAIFRREFKVKELTYFVLAGLSFIVIFNLSAIYHEKLGIKVSCARSAVDCPAE